MSCRRAQVTRKRQAKQRKKREEKLQLRSDVERVLVAMGVDALITTAGIPDEHLHRLKRPKPVVLPAPDQAHDPRLSELARELKRELDRVTVSANGIDVKFNDYWSIGSPPAKEIIRDLWGVSAGEADPGSNALRDLVEFIKDLDDLFHEKYEEATIKFLAEHSRLDASLYSARQISPSEGVPTLTTILSKHAPETASIVEEGIKRRAYRCGGPEDITTGGINWLSWEPKSLGWGKGPSLPVFIQSHAIEQAARRLSIQAHVPEQMARRFNIQDQECLLQYYIWTSLKTPRLTPLDKRGFLVDMVINDEKRIGYLVGIRLPDRVLIKTFLLPTMRGTPESQELYRRLKLRRPDIEHLGLDDIGTLAATDLLRDPDIAKIFDECGFGDFSKSITAGYQGEIFDGYSKRFKAYLGLK